MEKAFLQTINLTRIKEGNYYQCLLDKKFTYDEEIKRRVAIKREFLEQRRLAEEMHHNRSIRLISDAIEAIKKFVSKSLDLNKTGLFDIQSDQIYGETLYLDMHISDHEMTYVMIEKAVKKLVKSVNVLRVKANQAKKRNILELTESCRQSSKIFIIVEQAECMTRLLTDTLVGHLRNRLSDETSPTTSVMILFCLSIKIQILPFETMHCFGRMKGIMKPTEENGRARAYELLRSCDLKVKLAPKTLDFINLHALIADASITNINYLHCYCLFEHYNRLGDKALLSKRDYDKLESEHQWLCDDLQCLTRFLTEHKVWPEDATDLYEELGRYEDLSQSEEFYNAIQRTRNIPHDRLVARLEAVEQEFGEQVITKNSSKRLNAVTIIMSYKETISNNKDSKELVTKLMNDIMEYTRNIKCPFGEYPNFYFNNRRALMAGCSTTSRDSRELTPTYLDQSSFFGICLGRILSSSGQIAASELCEEVVGDFKELINASRLNNRAAEESKPSPPKRSRRRTTIRATKQCVERNLGLAAEDTEGLARAIFVDTIDVMEHQGIIKLDARTKGRIIKRLAWPMETSWE